jgi:uncharacterized membrane protein HdeD (DUF308 family)
MQKFVDLTLKPVLIIGGALTATAGLNAFLPRVGVEQVFKLEFVPSYTILVQHWGIMVCLLGVLMVVAAFKEGWRPPILLYAMLEKAFIVALVGINAGERFANGFMAPAVMDALIVAWTVVYFASLRRARSA